MSVAHRRDARNALGQSVFCSAVAGTLGDFVSFAHTALVRVLAAFKRWLSVSLFCTALKASFSGLPVVAYRSEDPAEIIFDGKTDLIMLVWAATVSAVAMRKLSEETSCAVYMSVSDRAHVMATITPELFVRFLRGPIREKS